MSDGVERQTSPRQPVFDTLQDQRATMARLIRTQFFQGQPVLGNNTVIQRAASLDLIQTTGKRKTEISNVTGRHGPLINTDQRFRRDMTPRFFEGLTDAGSNQRLTFIQMPGRLIKAQAD